MADDLVKILFHIDKDEDGYPPEDVESLWARPVADGYEIDNIPFFVRGIAYKDVVGATQASDGALEFDGRTVRRSGHSTYRVLLLNADQTSLEEAVDELEALGVGVESDIGSLLAVDVPPELDSMFRNYLFDGLDAGRWEVEEGHRATQVAQ